MAVGGVRSVPTAVNGRQVPLPAWVGAYACLSFARLGADVVRYSFIVVDLHHLLLAGLPAHLCEKSEVQFGFRTSVSISLDLKTNSASNCRREKTTKKTILRFFCRCDFSHSLGRKRTPPVTIPKRR